MLAVLYHLGIESDYRSMVGVLIGSNLTTSFDFDMLSVMRPRIRSNYLLS